MGSAALTCGGGGVRRTDGTRTVMMRTEREREKRKQTRAWARGARERARCGQELSGGGNKRTGRSMGCGSRSCGPRRARAPKANGSTTSTRREYCTLLFAEGHTVYVCIVAAREKDRLRDISLYRCLSACSLPVLPQEIRCILLSRELYPPIARAA